MNEPTSEDIAAGIFQHLKALATQNKEVHWAITTAIARAERDWYAQVNGHPGDIESIGEIKVGGTD